MKYILGIVMLLSIVMVSAVTCNQNDITLNYDEGEIPSDDITITSCTAENTTDINFVGGTKIHKGSDMNSISGTKNLRIQIDADISPGSYYPIFSFGDESNPVYITLNIEEVEETPQGCIIDIFPTILTNIKVQQGETKTRNIQLSVPSCYTSPVTANGVALQTDEKPIQLGEINIGTIQPGNSVVIPIEIDAQGISTGQYSDVLQFLLYDNLGTKINVPSVSISVLTTSGIQPITNFSLTDLPVCSIDGLEMSLNSSRRLTCSVTNPNIDIHPLIDSKYIKGLSVSETTSQYIYTFQPILIGTSSIGAEFLYKNAPLGSPFNQEIRISPSGNTPTSGITTRFEFYQDTSKKNIEELLPKDTIIQIIDNKTGNILTDYTLYINGLVSNNTVILESDKDYEMRSSVPGYLDGVLNFKVNQSIIQITLEPDKSFYEINDKVNITCSAINCSYLLDNVVITSPYTFTSYGIKNLEAVKQGYIKSNKSIDVRSSITYTSMSHEFDDWKKGKNIAIELTKNSTWEVTHDGEVIENGTSNLVEFKIKEYGNYQVLADGNYVIGKLVESNFDWYPWNWESTFWRWTAYIVLGIVVLGGGWYLLQNKKPESEDSGFVMEG